MVMMTRPGVALVVGATGQDGYFLVQQLLSEGWTAHAVSNQADILASMTRSCQVPDQLHTHCIDLVEPRELVELIARVQPQELYNLGGLSSVSQSFAEPLYTWRTNSEAVVNMLEAIRRDSPHTRFYQSSSTDMFGHVPGGTVLHSEDSVLGPQSPYAGAKAAAHLLCHTYREVYGLRIACGILSNHESHRRPAPFLTRKVVDHVRTLRHLPDHERRPYPPLALGHLKVERDWGYAPDFVEGIRRILRQIQVRAELLGKAPEADGGANYRDYVLGTGKPHAVWQLVDRAFALGGFNLEWELEGDDPTKWRARFGSADTLAVVVDPKLWRPADPLAIHVDPSRARKELGWVPQQGVDVFLKDMLESDLRSQHAGAIS